MVVSVCKALHDVKNFSLSQIKPGANGQHQPLWYLPDKTLLKTNHPLMLSIPRRLNALRLLYSAKLKRWAYFNTLLSLYLRSNNFLTQTTTFTQKKNKNSKNSNANKTTLQSLKDIQTNLQTDISSAILFACCASIQPFHSIIALKFTTLFIIFIYYYECEKNFFLVLYAF